LTASLTLCTDVNKILYGALVMLLYHFKLERGAMDKESMDKVFLDIRKREMTPECDPIADQCSECDPQAIPLAAGIKVIPRDPEALARWIADAPTMLDQFDQADLSIKAAGES
jgi:hypothetical protein